MATWREQAGETLGELERAKRAIRRRLGKRGGVSLNADDTETVFMALQHAEYICEHVAGAFCSADVHIAEARRELVESGVWDQLFPKAE